jgi:hypothetical protein
MTRLVAALLAITTASAIACGNGEPSGPTATAQPTATAEGGLTRIPEVEAVIAVLFAGDPEAVEARIGYASVACAVAPTGLGAPPQCPEGVADGTPVDALPWAQCEGTYIFPEDIENTVQFLSTPGASLFGIYRVEESFPPGEFVALYTKTGGTIRPDGAYGVFMDEGLITGLHAGCNQTPEEFVEFYDLQTVFLSPRPTPPPGRTGVLLVDAVLDALEAGDIDTLRQLVAYQALACAVEPGAGGPPPCRADEPDGTLVEVLPIRTCELEHHRRGEIDWALQDLIEHTSPYAVYQAEGGYVIVLERTFQGMRLSAAVTIADRNITELKFGCGETPEQLVEVLGLVDVVLPPAD